MHIFLPAKQPVLVLVGDTSAAAHCHLVVVLTLTRVPCVKMCDQVVPERGTASLLDMDENQRACVPQVIQVISQQRRLLLN